MTSSLDSGDGRKPPATETPHAQERNPAVERWLREEVVSICDAMQADPGCAIPADIVFAELRAQHAARLKSKR